MFKVTAAVDIPVRAIEARLAGAVGKEGGGRDWLQTRIIRDCEPFVPVDSGELASSVSRSARGIVYAAPHASRVYYAEKADFSGGKKPRPPTIGSRRRKAAGSIPGAGTWPALSAAHGGNHERRSRPGRNPARVPG